ncbi:MAG: DUF4185 domain-containing protein [Treponema sp.]|jgi:hypothetical protein|nr:DUF4185 domain-containing protein [Treponema sp.]
MEVGRAVKQAALILGAALCFLSCRGKGAESPGPAPAEAAAPESPAADPGEARFNEYRQKRLNYPARGKDFPYNLKGLRDVRIVEALTGEYSINRTFSNYHVFGTDLGIIFDKGEDLFIAFGDTFSGPDFSGDWRSNVLAVTRDRDASDGILFDRMISTRVNRRAIEILHSRKRDNLEMTVIPTGGFSIGEALYLCYMSVRRWGPPGRWDCNYGGIARSLNNGQSWEKLEDLRWDGAGLFVQLCPVRHQGWLYFYGIGGGRGGPAGLMRVREGQVEDRAAYEYFIGLEEGRPLYRSGGEAEEHAAAVIPGPAGELSVMYNPYLEEWLAACLSGENLVIRSSRLPEGPFSPAHIIARQSDYPGLYGAFMHPAFTEDNGRIIYFLTSFYAPVYNVSVMGAELLR